MRARLNQEAGSEGWVVRLNQATGDSFRFRGLGSVVGCVLVQLVIGSYHGTFGNILPYFTSYIRQVWSLLLFPYFWTKFFLGRLHLRPQQPPLRRYFFSQYQYSHFVQSWKTLFSTINKPTHWGQKIQFSIQVLSVGGLAQGFASLLAGDGS